MKTLLCIQSHYGKPGAAFREAEKRDDAIVVRQTDLQAKHFEHARGLITTMHIDQIGLMLFQDALISLLNKGGRWFFNGHIMRVFVDGLSIYQPIRHAGKEDLRLTPLNEHAIFTGVDRDDLGVRKGVAGFYGRGHNPMPEGAQAITGLGPQRFALDWDWPRPAGGRIFSHAGNDLPGTAGSEEVTTRLARNIIAWTMAEEAEL